NQESVVQDARAYLVIVGLGMIFSFMNQIFTGIFTALGMSLVTFRSTLIGLGANIVLDPVFIFGVGPIPDLGVAGAALATVLAQGIVFAMFLRNAGRTALIFSGLGLRRKSSRQDVLDVVR